MIAGTVQQLDWAQRDGERLEPNRAARVLAALNPGFAPGKMNPRATVVMRKRLSFYRGADLYSCTDMRTMPPVTKFGLFGDSVARPLDWTNKSVYLANAEAPIWLDYDTAVDYVRFFFFAVHGQHGRFRVVETVEDLGFLQNQPSHVRAAFSALCRTPWLQPSDGSHRFVVGATVLYRDALLGLSVGLSSQGHVDIFAEHVLVEGLPVQPEMALR